MMDVACAVSGGVDSLTLATLAHRRFPGRATMFHAVSPAVPAEATRRTQALAEREGWRLEIIDAGEFLNGQYRANPSNRCYFCKTSLYGAIRPATTAQIVSGTNLDDLGEYRPGLEAAKEHDVRHPFVEAGIDKATVRSIARALDLDDVAELPSAPCLSSRIETGIGIDPDMLACVHEAEQLAAATLAPRTVRCRVRAGGVVIELDAGTLDRIGGGDDELATKIATIFRTRGFERAVSFAPYRVGSAFLHPVKFVRT
ncbi:MAG: adenine nucleotide alpha hydrolase [Betaproteobacteria bacterium]|nr:adenine nucleotide alpha hydrolase [Betaproteobacteria bacterium]